VAMVGELGDWSLSKCGELHGHCDGTDLSWAQRLRTRKSHVKHSIVPMRADSGESGASSTQAGALRVAAGSHRRLRGGGATRLC